MVGKGERRIREREKKGVTLRKDSNWFPSRSAIQMHPPPLSPPLVESAPEISW